MVNSDNGAIIPEILNSVAIVYNWPEFTGQVTKRTVAVHIDTLAKYTGTYTLDRITLRIFKKDNSLYLAQDDSAPVKMYFTSQSDFFIKEVKAESSFVKNEQGIVDGILIKQEGREFKAQRKL